MSESNSLQPLQPTQPSRPVDKVGPGPQKSEKQGPDFAEVLKNSIQEVNALQKEANAAIEQLQTGKTESVTEVLTAVEKADLAFRALMQVRNKLVDAYEEVNRLRV